MESDKKDEFPNDGRKKGDYKTRYPDKKCQFKIKRDAIYISALLFLALLSILLNFLEVFETVLKLEGDKKTIFHKAMYCVTSGLLGGATFGMKYFYRVVARGLWNEDRVYWRMFSPFIAVSLSVVMAAIMVKDVFSSSALAISVGFLTGYFSDEAVSKMYDVACVLFLKSNTDNSENKKRKEIKLSEEMGEDYEDMDG